MKSQFCASELKRKRKSDASNCFVRIFMFMNEINLVTISQYSGDEVFFTATLVEIV